MQIAVLNTEESGASAALEDQGQPVHCSETFANLNKIRKLDLEEELADIDFLDLQWSDNIWPDDPQTWPTQ